MAESVPPPFGEFICGLALQSSNIDRGYVRKKAFRKEWVVPMGAPMFIASLVFQTAAVLGYTRPNADRMAELLGLGREDESKPYLDAFRTTLSSWLAKSSREPDTLHDVWNLAQFPEIDMREMRTMEMLAKGEVRLGVLLNHARAAATYGVGFGMIHSPRFEELWRRTFETPMPEADWNAARTAGLAIPERQEVYPLAKAQGDTLNQTAAYVRLHRPKLLEPLDLASYGFDE
jgi:hypothetical protein